jgi:glutathione reductase (NADPH)
MRICAAFPTRGSMPPVTPPASGRPDPGVEPRREDRREPPARSIAPARLSRCSERGLHRAADRRRRAGRGGAPQRPFRVNAASTPDWFTARRLAEPVYGHKF